MRNYQNLSSAAYPPRNGVETAEEIRAAGLTALQEAEVQRKLSICILLTALLFLIIAVVAAGLNLAFVFFGGAQ